MIISIGGTIEPIIKTITDESHKPQFICFFASNDSVNMLGEIKNETGCEYEQAVIITDNPNDLVLCYQKSLDCIEKLKQKSIEPANTLVDITGGTKIMSAALALAALGKGYTFSYVGGKERTKAGLGVVISGSEEIFQNVGPWQIFAVEEKRALSHHINSYRFASAVNVLEGLIKRGIQVKSNEFFKPLKHLVQGYIDWEAFRHKDAISKLEKGFLKLNERLEIINSIPIGKFRDAVQKNFKFLKDMKKTTEGFTKISKHTLIDLSSNAERRAEEGVFDDATVRVYRMLEMAGQGEFLETFGHTTDKAKLDYLPESIRNEYAKKYESNGKDAVKLPLHATFRALKEKGNKIGERYFEKFDDIKKVQAQRNLSFLVHGFNPTTQKGYEKILKLVKEFLEITDEVKFPKLEGDW